MGKIGGSATVIFFAIGAILAAFGVQGMIMPQPLFIISIIIMLLMVIIAFSVLIPEGLKAFGATEWRRRRVYRILGVPKTIKVGEHEISITLQLRATRYIGQPYTYFVKEKGSGKTVAVDLVTVAVDRDKENYRPGIRNKGEEVSFVLKIYAKSQWKGYLTFGFSTEDNTIPYIHFPITVK